MSKSKEKDNVFDEIRKKYGDGAIATFNGDSKLDVDSISTGCKSLDNILEIGGFPRGKIIEVYGASGSGKTSLCVHLASETQKLGEMVAYIDVENAVSTKYFNNLGVDVENPDLFMLCQSNSAEEALDIVEMLVKSNRVGLIVIDSVAALVPLQEQEGDMADSTISLQARLLSKAMRRLSSMLYDSKVCVVFINQIRDNIGTFGYGPKTTTPGGKAIPFYASLRIELSKIGQIKDKDQVIGSQIKAKVVKSRVSSPFREANYAIIFGKGISKEYEIMENALSMKVIEQKGAWIYYNGETICQGKNNLLEMLETDPVFLNEVKNKIEQDDTE